MASDNPCYGASEFHRRVTEKMVGEGLSPADAVFSVASGMSDSEALAVRDNHLALASRLEAIVQQRAFRDYGEDDAEYDDEEGD